ncbi:MAG: hypothetical protein WC683_05020 [bacterium]
MVKYAADAYLTGAALEAALEAIDNTTGVEIIPYREDGHLKFLLVNRGAAGTQALEAGNLLSIKTAVEKIDDLQDATVAEAGTPTKGVQVLLDNGSSGIFAQGNATGALKVTGDPAELTATIAQDASLSGAIAVMGRALKGMVTPAALEAGATVCTFQTSTDNSTFQELVDDAGNAVSVTLPATYTSINISFDTIFGKLFGWPYVKVRFDTVASPKVQTAARTLKFAVV